MVDGRRVPLSRDAERSGWWTGSEPLAPGARYGFLLDGKGPFPDPRSRSQPDGVHGLSCWVEFVDFQWSDVCWHPPSKKNAVIYELHIGTFSEVGTFEGAISKLGALVELGVTHVELMPVCEFPGRRGWGYDGVQLYAPHRAYGGPDGLVKLIDACHAAGLAVLIDVVYNHLGPDGNYLPLYGPYFSDRHMTPWGQGPHLDGPGSQETRDFFIGNALMWLRDYHADGLRLDAIDKVADDSPRHFLVELREKVDALSETTGRDYFLVAESASNDPVFVLPAASGGYAMDAQWNDDIHHAIHAFFTGERETYYVDYGTLEDWATAMRDGFVYSGRYSEFRKRTHGKSPAGLPGYTFLAYLQTHDQVGNRARGERFHQLPGAGPIEQKIAVAFVLLSPFIPMIFMGEEWAASTPFLYFTDHTDPALATAVSEGRRREFGGSAWDSEVPDPQDLETFSRSKLRWKERDLPVHREMLGWYSKLLRLRRSDMDFHPSDHDQRDVAFDTRNRWLSMRRGDHIVVASFSDGGCRVNLSIEGGFAVVLHAGACPVVTPASVDFSGPGVAVIRTRRGTGPDGDPVP